MKKNTEIFCTYYKPLYIYIINNNKTTQIMKNLATLLSEAKEANKNLVKLGGGEVKDFTEAISYLQSVHQEIKNDENLKSKIGRGFRMSLIKEIDRLIKLQSK